MGILLCSIGVNVIILGMDLEDWLGRKFLDKMPDSEITSTVAEAPSRKKM